MRNPLSGLPTLLIALTVSSAAWPAPPRFDSSTDEGFRVSGERVLRSVEPAQLESFRRAYELLMADAMCPADPDRPNIEAMLEREGRIKAAIHGKTVEDVIQVGARIRAALEAEREAMPEQGPDSPLGKEIRSAVLRYLDELPAGADNFSAMFPFWTRARVAYAEALKPPATIFDDMPGYQAPAPHRREMTAMLLYEDEWLRKLRVVKVLASPTKAYVFLGNPEKSVRTTWLRDSGGWQAHADLFGYPWSRENTEAVECIEH